MNVKRLLPAVLVLVALAAPGAHAGSDYAKEKRWADQIVDNLFVGQAVYLQANGHKFLALYTEPKTTRVKGGAIIMHGKGVHPNWTDVIYPLRTQLPEHGWYTLSLQMPVLPNGASDEAYSSLVPEAAPRIAAAVEFLKSKGVSNIVLIGHSLGNSMGAYYLAHDPSPNVHAFVGIGMSMIRFKENVRTLAASLAKIRIPVFDFSGSRDVEQNAGLRKERLAIARKAGNRHYTQEVQQGADHFFAARDDVLVKTVSDWLDQNAVK